MSRMPVILRIDGKAFHTYTRGFNRPFDSLLMRSMQETMKYLCENIQGCVLGYTQSDEISLVLVDYKKFTSSAWFDNEIQKMVSIAASMATMEFNKVFTMLAMKEGCAVHREQAGLAQFDCRAFNLSKDEVTNYLCWRQADATRNSIQMVGQAHFLHKELQNKSCNEIQDMLILQKVLTGMICLLSRNVEAVLLRRNTFLKMVVTGRIGLLTERFLFSKEKSAAM